MLLILTVHFVDRGDYRWACLCGCNIHAWLLHLYFPGYIPGRSSHSSPFPLGDMVSPWALGQQTAWLIPKLIWPSNLGCAQGLLVSHIVLCRAKPKGGICSLYKWADTAFWLCRAALLDIVTVRKSCLGGSTGRSDKMGFGGGRQQATNFPPHFTSCVCHNVIWHDRQI